MKRDTDYKGIYFLFLFWRVKMKMLIFFCFRIQPAPLVEDPSYPAHSSHQNFGPQPHNQHQHGHHIPAQQYDNQQPLQHQPAERHHSQQEQEQLQTHEVDFSQY